MVSVDSDKNCEIYHLLCAAFGQCVAISQVVDFNVFDVITILLVDFIFGGRSSSASWRHRSSRCRARALSLLKALSAAQHCAVRTYAKLTIRTGGTSTCCTPFFALIEALIFAAAAAAAAAASFLSVPPGLSMLFATGLRDRCASESCRCGDRERRSNLDFFAASGS